MTKATTKTVASLCPICKAAAVERYRPFCSARCATIDLGRWLKGAYAIPAEPVAIDEEDED
jgi:hypothetical protein